jgi:dUTP pyrophosphatase
LKKEKKLENHKLLEKVKIFVNTKNLKLLPKYGSEFAAGADLCADIEDDLILKPSESILVPTGLFVEIPKSFEVQIRPRSGLALKNQITVLNTPGTIDSDYRGEIKIILINHGKNDFVIKPFMRIAQAVVSKVYSAEFITQEKLAITERAEGGFGHTGIL